MAEYDYEEGGFMALYFLLTFLTIVLIPLTSSSLIPSFKKESLARCDCSECTAKQAKAKRRASFLGNLTSTGLITLGLWGIVAAIVYKLATTKIDSKIYDPFQILGLAPTSDEKAIKRHYKKLSVKFHPDKVKLVVNQTIEMVSNHFVDLTKAYKALTDETVRENLRLYGNPDGKQDFKVGIALPPWVIESSNNGWVLGAYGLLFGGALPYLVGKWWFGSRSYTKDGVKGKTAEVFFKGISEDDSLLDVTRVLAHGWETEVQKTDPATEAETKLRARVEEALGQEQWQHISKGADEPTKRGLILIFAHLLRFSVDDSKLSKEQESLLLKTPQLLSSLLAMALSRNWLVPTLHIMHLHAYIAQALVPGSDELLQLPSVNTAVAKGLTGAYRGARLVNELAEKGEQLQAKDVRTAATHLGKLEIMDVYFKVIGERIVTPGAIVQLVFQARLVPPTAALPRSPPPRDTDSDAGTLVAKSDSASPTPTKREAAKDERHQAFWTVQKDTEVLDDAATVVPLAHAPRWPGDRKPQWWVFIGDQKQNRVFVPPMRFTDVPLYDPTASQRGKSTDRLYKLTFQAPQTAGVLPLQVHFVSDSFVGDDVRRSVTLKVEDTSALTAEEQGAEDDISDPEEDSLAGQMAALRGGSVKRAASGNDSDEDDESTTDGESAEDSDSDSDSD